MLPNLNKLPELTDGVMVSSDLFRGLSSLLTLLNENRLLLLGLDSIMDDVDVVLLESCANLIELNG